MNKMAFLDEPPPGDGLTNYDKEHLATYLRLLDAEAEGADWQAVTPVIFGIDPNGEADRAKHVHASHLARAHWMRDSGFQHLLDKK